MMTVKLICVGKLKERFYAEAVSEYAKRLGAYCKLEIEELPEAKTGNSTSPSEIEAGLSRDAQLIERAVPKGARLVAMCIEGDQLDSEGVARLISECAVTGASKLCFVIGGSYGMSDRIKRMADVRLSMSKMTFPHHLARVMLLEQIYRGFKIIDGGKYHK